MGVACAGWPLVRNLHDSHSGGKGSSCAGIRILEYKAESGINAKRVCHMQEQVRGRLGPSDTVAPVDLVRLEMRG